MITYIVGQSTAFTRRLDQKWITKVDQRAAEPVDEGDPVVKGVYPKQNVPNV